ncbi:MAG: hypothetical protein EPN85_01015 [Bacteroidetes bacterium]|nr:MAG: hypothetical protein EPN85_01015 [Bacteroidota bacterium]
MKSSDSLFKLIKSMNGAEKGYFKKYSKINGLNAGSNYLLLFDAIDSQRDYDETQFLKKFNNQPFARQFPVAKNYLYEKILASLDSFHHDTSSEIQKLLHSAEILFRMGLYDQALKILRKAKKMAIEQDLFSYLLEIYQWEFNIAIEKQDAGWADKINHEWEKAILLSQNTQAYRILYIKMGSLFLNYGKTRDQKVLNTINGLLKNPFLKNESRALTFYSKVRFYDTHFFYWCIRGDKEQMYKHAKKTITLFHSCPGKIKDQMGIYLDALGNILFISLKMRKQQEASHYLGILKEIAKNEKSKDINAQLFYVYISHLLWYYNNMGRFDLSVKEMPDVLRNMTLYENELNQVEKALLFIHIAISFFGVRDYKNSLLWANKIKNEISLMFRADLYSFIKLFYLIVQYENGHIDILPNLTKSSHRFLSNIDRVSKFETIMLSFIKNKLPIITSRKDTVKYFSELKKQIGLIGNDAHLKNTNNFFDLWIESKIQNKTFKEMLQMSAD